MAYVQVAKGRSNIVKITNNAGKKVILNTDDRVVNAVIIYNDKDDTLNKLKTLDTVGLAKSLRSGQQTQMKALTIWNSSKSKLMQCLKVPKYYIDILISPARKELGVATIRESIVFPNEEEANIAEREIRSFFDL